MGDLPISSAGRRVRWETYRSPDKIALFLVKSVMFWQVSIPCQSCALILTSLAEWKRTTQHANCLAHCVDLADGPEYKNQLQPLWMKIIAQCLQSFGILSCKLHKTNRIVPKSENGKFSPGWNFGSSRAILGCHAGVTQVSRDGIQILWSPSGSHPPHLGSFFLKRCILMSIFHIFIVLFETLHFDVHLSYFQESEQPSVWFAKPPGIMNSFNVLIATCRLNSPGMNFGVAVSAKMNFGVAVSAKMILGCSLSLG